MRSLLAVCALVATLTALEQQCSNTTLLVVPSVCGNADKSVCTALSALRFCSNLTVSINSTVTMTNGESYLMELGSANNLVWMSSQVVHMLAEHVFLSSTVIARAIMQLTQQFGWRRLMIVADIADAYFLHTAEKFYRMADLSSDSTLQQLSNSDSEIVDLLNQVDRLNLRIIVLSLRSQLVCKLLCRAHERHLVWPEYAWIVHSVEVSEKSCGENVTLDGVITVQLNNRNMNHTDTQPCALQNIAVHSLVSCNISNASQRTHVIQIIGEVVHTFLDNETEVAGSLPYPSDLPPQYVPTLYITLFYTATAFCFIICTISLVLYVYFRREPAIKATSVSLSTMIFIGCYLLIVYLLILNSSLLPSYYKQGKGFRNFMCACRTSFNGVGYPLVLILSTLLVKLLRVYRLFNLKKRVGKFTTSNAALAVFVLLMTAPNALASIIWYVVDPYTSTVIFSIRNRFLHISVQCISNHFLLWSFLLLSYTVILSLLLIVFAILTRKIKYRNFKDTKKVSVLSFLLLFTCATTVFYVYLLRIIGADDILPHTMLQIGHYCAILECQGFIFAPKLLPIVKEKLKQKFYKASNTPAPKKFVG